MKSNRRSKFPRYKLIEYRQNPKTKYFELESKPAGFNKTTDALIVEETRREDIKKIAPFMIRSREKDNNNKSKFLTGMIKSQIDYVYFGDCFERINNKKVNSFVLFVFSYDKTRLSIYFFDRYKLYPKVRKSFIARFLKWIRDGKE